MAISSWNKRSKTVRIKITKNEMRSLSPKAGINIVQYAPNIPFVQDITHPTGLVSHIETQSSGFGEMNVILSTSGCTFVPTERRYQEDIEKALEGLNIVTEKVTEKDEPRHVNNGIKNKDMNLDLMEHSTFYDMPTLDTVDKVRTIMEQNKTKKAMRFDQSDYMLIEKMMGRRPAIYGTPSNTQAVPRFMKVLNEGARNPVTGLREFEADIGVY